MSMSLAQNIILFLWLGAIAFWIFRAFGNKRTAHQQPLPPRLFAVPLLLIALVTVIDYAAGQVLERSVVPDTTAAAYTALALVMAGIAYGVWARVTIGRNWSGLVTVKEDHALITSGPYAYTRHPIYVGIIWASLGSALAFRQLVGFVCVLVVAVTLALKARVEERLMTDQFGDAYRSYASRVKALVPFVF
ncbi:MAG: isoprenylcysteine carboxylmethyltransferase family protein [Pseudomonadota bacterium]|nr:isoprenylcysteine carboxylmethyltransferase family protein [Pseudomonadota bacterium]